MRLPKAPKRLRVIGIDDAPFTRRPRARVHLAGVVCAGTRFEGLLWGKTERDGWGATATISRMVRQSKYWQQAHLILLDGIAVGGFNVIDLPLLAAELERPCVAVMRRLPNLTKLHRAVRQLPNAERRLRLFDRAGPVYDRQPFVFQVQGADVEAAHDALLRVTDTGHVPEALRLAHLIGSAIVTGESRGRA